MTTFQNPSDATIADYLRTSKVIAVVGLSNRKETAAYRVSAYMQEAGYQIIPVNPKLAGQTILGQAVYPDLVSIPDKIDIVNVFRRSEFLPEVATAFLQTDAQIFWAQLGLISQEAADILIAAGREQIVMDRCIKIEHAELLR